MTAVGNGPPSQPGAFAPLIIPANVANALVQTLADLLDEATDQIWHATQDPDSFNRATAWQACLDIKARAHAAVDAAFAPDRLNERPPSPPPNRLIVEGGPHLFGPVSFCPACGSSVRRKWLGFGTVIGCIQPLCREFYRRKSPDKFT